jgi:DNA-binding transcriptional regulator of glucitol operon
MPLPPIEPKKNRNGMIIAIVIIVLCCCCVVAALGGKWLWDNGDNMLGTSLLINSLAAL